MIKRRDVSSLTVSAATPPPGARRARRRGGLAVAAALAIAALAPPVAGATVGTPQCTAPYGTVPFALPGAPLTFGIYPGGYAGAGTDPGVPNNPVEIERALDQLQGSKPHFIVRGYTEYHNAPTDGDPAGTDPEYFDQYIHDGRRLDLVIEYASESGSIAGWKQFVHDQILRYGSLAETISVTLEPNLENTAIGRRALVEGVPYAKQIVEQAGLRAQIGFNAVNFGVPFDLAFWTQIGNEAGQDFLSAIDYVGVDLYAGAFWDVAPDGQPGDRDDVVRDALMMTRNCSLPLAGIDDSVPLRITENGWPVFDTRTEQQQAAAFDTVIRTVNSLRGPLKILSYEAFALRDDTTLSDNLFDHLGLLHDDYSRKPAFHTYKNLIGTLG
jgi:hypothetical protein